MLDRTNIYDLAHGRWHAILTRLGANPKWLNGKQQPCPWCGGEDRFVFDDKGKDGKRGAGGFCCRGCGSGNGVDFAKRLTGIEDFREIVKRIEEIVGQCPVRVSSQSQEPSAERVREEMCYSWGRARPLTGDDIASRYLTARGLDWRLVKDGSAIRLHRDLSVPKSASTTIRSTPTMLAKFAAPDGKAAVLHKTYLVEPGEKAPFGQKARMNWYGSKLPEGGAVRLAPAGEIMGVAEGIETALAAMMLHGIPVWSCLNATMLEKWVPPKGCRKVIVFGDNDMIFRGQRAAYTLGELLRHPKFKLEDVQVEIPREIDTDWNDVLKAEALSDA